MAVKIKATVIKVEPTVEGEYLGTPYKYANVLVEQEREANEEWNPCKLVARIKGQKLEDFEREGIGNDGLIHEFTLHFEASQTKGENAKIYNKVPTIVAFK